MLIDWESRVIRFDDDPNTKAAVGRPNEILDEYTFGDADIVYDAIKYAHMYEQAYGLQHSREAEAALAKKVEDPTPAMEKTRHWEYASYLRDLIASDAMAELIKIVPPISRKQVDSFYGDQKPVIDLNQEIAGVVVDLAAVRKLAQASGRFPHKVG